MKYESAFSGRVDAPTRRGARAPVRSCVCKAVPSHGAVRARSRVLVAALLAAGTVRADDFWTGAHDRSRLRAAAWFGVVDQQLLASNRTFTYTTSSGKSLALDGAKLGAMQSLAGNLGVRVYWRGPFYASAEGFFGGAVVPSAYDKHQNLFAAGDLRFTAEGGGALGVDVARHSVVETAFEAYVGARAFNFFVYHGTGVRRVWYGEGVVEPRARVSVWVARQLTVDLWAGTNLVEPGEARLGLTLTIRIGQRRPLSLTRSGASSSSRPRGSPR